jgi:hypothetical protein
VVDVATRPASDVEPETFSASRAATAKPLAVATPPSALLATRTRRVVRCRSLVTGKPSHEPDTEADYRIVLT